MNSKIEIESITAVGDAIASRASMSIIIMPDNWDKNDEPPIYRTSAQAVLKLWAKAAIPYETLTDITSETHLRDDRSLDWVAPVLLVSSMLLTQNPSLVSIALGIIANYVTDLFKGIKKDPVVRLTIIQTETEGKKSRRLHYEGPVSGLQEVNKAFSDPDPKG